jgi:peptide-methionine (S)-S-oxide reductase
MSVHDPDAGGEDAITLGGGCFWCLEAVFQEVEGVTRVVSGYAGGHLANPSYEAVCRGDTGHAEVVRVHFRPERVNLADLLRVFFVVHDPTTRDRQGADVGPQYRSVILWRDEAQRDVATQVMAEVEASGACDGPLVTELAPLTAFYEAEADHQDYRRRNPRQPYCRVVIDPKLEKFRRVFARLRRGTPLLIAALAAAALLTSRPHVAVSQKLLSTSEMLARAPSPADARISYGSEDSQFGDLYLPPGDAAAPYPVAVVVHGGCWRTLASLDYTSHMARAFAEQGWAVWNLEFRRIDQEGGAWPGILEDVAQGTDHVREVARSHPLDLSRVAAVGHSSGGHLALWLAARHTLPPDEDGPRLRGDDPLRLRAVVALAAIADLDEFHARRPRGCGDGIVPALIGGVPEDLPARLALTSPAARLPLGTDQFLITGSEDRTVPPAHGRVYAERARTMGDRADFFSVDGAGHFELVAPWASGFRMVSAALGSALDRTRPTLDSPAHGRSAPRS